MIFAKFQSLTHKIDTMVICNGSQSKSPGLAISAIFGSD